MLSSYVRLLDPTVNCCLPQSNILWLRKFLLVSPTPCRSLSVDCECSALVLGGRIIAVVSPWQGWSLWSAEPCQSAGVVWCGPMRGRWWALQKGNRLFQMAGLWWSAQLPQTWSSYSISPTSHPVITLSLPLCYAIPDPPAVSGLISRSLSLCLIPSLSLLANPIFLYSLPHSFAYKNTMRVLCFHDNVLLPYSYTIVIWIVTSGLGSNLNWCFLIPIRFLNSYVKCSNFKNPTLEFNMV